MDLLYKYDKDLPSAQLRRLFKLAGWADGPETAEMIRHFNMPFLNSTLVISAWDSEQMVGVVRVLSDKIIRSVIYDLVIDPAFKNRGIGGELLKRCIAHYPDTEWLVQTSADISGYYEKHGFTSHDGAFLTIPSKYQNLEEQQS